MAQARGTRTIVRRVSWVVVGFWLAFWLWFLGAHAVDGLASGGPVALDGVLAGAGFFVVVVGVSAAAFAVPRVGGGLLVALGLLGTWFYMKPDGFMLSAWLLLCLPVLVAGAGLLLASGPDMRWRRRGGM